MSETLRSRLRATPPEHVALKRAWRRALQALRARKRATGAVPSLKGAGDIARALDQVVLSGPETEPTLRALKASLAILARGETPEAEAWAAAAAVDEGVQRLVAAEVQGPVAVSVTGWPAGTPKAVRVAVIGHDLSVPLAPLDAARLVHRLDGLAVAGGSLTVEVAVPEGSRLPVLLRAQRGDRGRWGRGVPWLPHLDEEGRYSLTPKSIGLRRARRLRALVVVDATAGCGGDTLSFALAGARVFAIEPAAIRRQHLIANARALGVSSTVQVAAGCAAEAAPPLLAKHPEALLFLDPPWGGPGAGMEGVLGWLEVHRDLLTTAPWVGLKVPRAFPVDRLPARSGGWRVQLELGDAETGDAQVVRMLTVVGGGPQPV